MVEKIVLTEDPDPDIYFNICYNGDFVDRFGCVPNEYFSNRRNLAEELTPLGRGAYFGFAFGVEDMSTTFEELDWRFHAHALRVAQTFAQEQGLAFEDRTSYAGKENPYGNEGFFNSS